MKKALADLRPLVDEVKRSYADLGYDPLVKQSLEVVKKTSRLRLGPSDAFLAGEKTLVRAERQILGKPTPVVSKKKKGKAGK